MIVPAACCDKPSGCNISKLDVQGGYSLSGTVERRNQPLRVSLILQTNVGRRAALGFVIAHANSSEL